MTGQALIFDGIDLEDSIVLGWTLSEGSLRVWLDVSLRSEHADYAKREAQERSCFRRGELVFSRAKDVVGLHAQQSVAPAGVEAGVPDYDTLHCLRLRGADRFYVEGEFGEVELTSDWPVLVLHGGAVSRARPVSS
jgi:hypothetical protein